MRWRRVKSVSHTEDARNPWAITDSVKLAYTMDGYRRMAVFVAVVEQGSIRRAASTLDLTPSAVSQQLKRLEAEVGTTLLRRSTRSLALTEAGRIFHEGCVAMVAAARQARAQLSALHDAPTGQLSVSCPTGFAETHLVTVIEPLLRAYPDLRLRLVVTDERVNVLKDGLDIAISIGEAIPSSGLVRRHLADWPLVLCAAPAYLARRGEPRTPAALAGHDLLSLPVDHHPRDVLTGPRGQRARMAAKPRVVSTNHFAVKRLVLAGGGLAFHVEPEIADELASGQLVRVLPHWRPAMVSVDALVPPQRHQPAKIRVALAACSHYPKGVVPSRAVGRSGRDKPPSKSGVRALP